MADQFEIPADPTERLAAAGTAWRALVNAEGEVARLSQYRRLTQHMRQDLARHVERADEARKRLHKLLAPETPR